jgi:hypothetical protein
VTLWPTLAQALQSKDSIDTLHCGGRCRRDHVIYRIEPASATLGT